MFLRHIPCLNCGSSDGRALYDDGSEFCFVCRKSSGGDPLKRLQERPKKAGRGVDGYETKELSLEALEWLKPYKLTDEELGLFSWHPVRKHLIYREGDFYNARNFGEGPKYKSYGDKPYRAIGVDGPRWVICEDIISAIVIGRETTALPLFGSSIRPDVLLDRWNGKPVSVWLDSDKWAEAAQLSFQLNSWGIPCRTIRTDRDPKYYTRDEVKWILSAI